MSDYQKAAGYFRVSSKEQSTDLHVSLPVQREKFANHTVARRYVPTGEYTDVESGRRDSRKEYQKMLTAARAKQIDVIVVQRLDRFGRNPREILRRVWELQDLGVAVEATDEDLSQEIAMMLHAFMAGEESKRISARVIPTMERVVREGRWPGGAPFGYQVIQDRASPQRGKLVVDEREAAIVRRVFEIYAAGNLGRSKIAGILNDEGVAAPQQALWWASTVEMILRNPVYIGLPKWRGIELPGGCPAIIDSELWQRTQSVMAGRQRIAVRNPPRETFLLVGLVRCACGTYRSGRRVFRDNYVDRRGYKRRPINYYRCAHAIMTKACKVGLVSAPLLETWVLDHVRRWRIPDVAITIDDDSAERRAKLAAQRASLRARIDRLRRRRDTAYDQLMDGIITREDYRDGDRRYLEEIAVCERDLAELRDIGESTVDRTHTILLLTELQRQLDTLPTERLRSLLMELIDRVDVVTRTEWRIVLKPELADVVGLVT